MSHHSLSPAIAVIIVIVAFAIYAGGIIIGRKKGYSGIGGRTIVRCNRGHLFTTIWLPGGSFKAIRLGIYRLQYCPVGKHWAFVRPVKDADLTEDQKQTALKNKDTRIP